MQRSRRRDPIPWTWEIPAAIILAILAVLTVGAQLGRSCANALSGAGWAWVPSAHLVTSLPGVLEGHADGGLPTMHHVASPHLLWGCVIAVELTLGTTVCWAAKVVADRWGPTRLRGMASRAEAEQLLGRARLRAVAPVIRPDLYGRKRSW
ncbi:hypothetical protein [Allobranchiibius sp. CTAmp26]|uniref:hypothetical protein n=1 Tax=Allobranchiibius sp. CTAmp26 TaxID=2815214 RepID=UPI001FB6D0E1|nr:hypothetical protein [Allobranchiibius sp. CTAmp26]